MSTSSTVISVISRTAIVIAALSTVSLIAILVLYFAEMSIPAVVMAIGIFGLPIAFILGGVVVVNNILQRRNS
ncbi:hypothetical protein [Glutamicibacter endophyticus]|uniref:hypothetical protein n=1 Tax=Glutamicibacter endophyticus TaxID=1522174 RepID=UPI003AF10F83